jgi:hypothetical protein
MVAALLATGLAVGAVRAAEPPVDVVLDGVVTVTWIDPEAQQPVAGGTITVAALADGAAEPFQLVVGTTDAAGVAVIGGIARPGAGTPPFALYVEGQKEEGPLPGDAGCSISLSWSAAAGPAAPAAQVAVTFEQTTVSSALTCPNPSSAGAVAALTGAPGVTAPNTATGDAAIGRPTSSGAAPILLAILIATAVALGASLPARRLRLRGEAARRR